MTAPAEPPHFDPSNFTLEPYGTRVEKPWGYELHWVPASAPYMGKLLHIKAGQRLSLQLHDQKQESWLLIQGQATAVLEDNQGHLSEIKLQVGQGYQTAKGQKHRLIARTDCDIIEVSTPEKGTTWRLQDDYGRPHETEAQRAVERGTK